MLKSRGRRLPEPPPFVYDYRSRVAGPMRVSNVPAEDIVAKLRSFPMFSDLAEEDIVSLASMVTLKQFKKGSFVISQNDRGSVMYLLVAGRVKVSLASPEGKELALNYLEAPSHFGEMSLVDAEPRSADVIAVTDTEVLALDARDLSAAIQVQPKLALTLIATLSRRVRGLIGRLEDVVFHDATLVAVVEAKPQNRRELLGINGVGPVKVERYGDEVLALVATHVPGV